MAVTDTPMIAQYKEIKSRHQEEILFFRLGDFYEMFFTDAETASRELEITLTSREGGNGTRIPMCGIPYHSAENYISRLIGKGFKVAICEQVEDPKATKGIVRREVIKVITPGTVLSETMLPDHGNNYLVVIAQHEAVLCLTAVDISTGECLWADYRDNDRLAALCDQLYHLMPAELVIATEFDSSADLRSFLNNRIPQCAVSSCSTMEADEIAQLPARHFPAQQLPACPAAIATLGILLQYLHRTLKTNLSHINTLTYLNAADSLILDMTALRNLEVTRNMRDGSKRETLLAVLDFTATAMGGRLLKKWLEYPLVRSDAIIERQDAIAELLVRGAERQLIKAAFKSVYDFERILTRIEVGTANARDLIGLKDSLAVVPALKQCLQPFRSGLLVGIQQALVCHDDITSLIAAAIMDAPPLSVRDGGLIREGYHDELDELRAMARDSKQWIQNLEAGERVKTGIKSLKVGYNKVFGYYLEVTHSNSAAVPANYVRKQTLANAERYITPELKEFETKILGAQEKIIAMEYALFTDVRDTLKRQIPQIQQTASQIALLDTAAALSEAAEHNNYVRPQIVENGVIAIKDGRHPVVERLLQQELFIPNDTALDHFDNEVMVITGPNMAGKSTYMRQVALLVLMAQTGSFIPAREAVISPVDRIFTRVGASDDLSSGQSTFMVEMNEVAQILKFATKHSLIILDEIGRGTSTFDGMSIARAVIEYINERIGAKTLFATHYHELIELADHAANIQNYSVAVRERGRQVVFLRRIVPGGADKSYGIHVAQLAGLPKKLIDRANDILTQLESVGHDNAAAVQSEQLQAEQTAAAMPISLFVSALTSELLAIDVLSTTPLEALNLLYRLQNQAKQEAGQL